MVKVRVTSLVDTDNPVLDAHTVTTAVQSHDVQRRLQHQRHRRLSNDSRNNDFILYTYEKISAPETSVKSNLVETHIATPHSNEQTLPLYVLAAGLQFAGKYNI